MSSRAGVNVTVGRGRAARNDGGRGQPGPFRPQTPPAPSPAPPNATDQQAASLDLARARAGQ